MLHALSLRGRSGAFGPRVRAAVISFGARRCAPTSPPVLEGPAAWEADETLRRAVEIRDGVVQNPTILAFQGRAAEYPHLAAG